MRLSTRSLVLALSSLFVSLLGISVTGVVAEEEDGLRQRLKDSHAEGVDLWVYNDLERAKKEARRLDKPIFVTFRCVPCESCAGFDAEVAQGNHTVRELARKEFVSVRQVEMKGVDLSQFQFDYDLNWAAMFVNADGTVYARYGTQSAAGPDAYNSIAGLEKTMRRVLELHAAYPENAKELAPKRGAVKPYKSALEMPGLENKEKLRGTTTRGNCIHCHNIHDAENAAAQRSGIFSQDMLWRYPLPDNVGLVLDPIEGIRINEVEPGSVAARAGLREGDTLLRVEGQPVTSIADVQWALHGLPNTNAQVRLETERGGRKTLALASGWKQTDISWRGSLWSIPPRLRVWTPPLGDDARKAHGLPEGQGALLVKWINMGSAGGRSARESGLRQGDIIVALEGKAFQLNPSQFNLHIKLHYKVGDDLPVTVLRNGKRREVRIKLVE